MSVSCSAGSPPYHGDWGQTARRLQTAQVQREPWTRTSSSPRSRSLPSSNSSGKYPPIIITSIWQKHLLLLLFFHLPTKWYGRSVVSGGCCEQLRAGDQPGGAAAGGERVHLLHHPARARELQPPRTGQYIICFMHLHWRYGVDILLVIHVSMLHTCC